MADWFIATEGVKVVKDSASVWPQIITAVSSVGAALCGVYFTHHFTRNREEKSASAKQDSDRQYIATELVFLLEQFAEGCARVATADGKRDIQGYMRVTEPRPEIDLKVVTGEWRSLPPRLLYAIRELPVLKEWSDREIAGMEESEGPPDFTRTIRERQYLYTRLGLKALIQARRLRQLACMPGTRLDATKWSAQQVLWGVWRQERNRRHIQAVLTARSFTMMQLAFQWRNDSRKNPPLPEDDAGE